MSPRAVPRRRCPAGCGRPAAAASVICPDCWAVLSQAEQDAFMVRYDLYRAHPTDPVRLLAMREARRTLVAAARRHAAPELELG